MTQRTQMERLSEAVADRYRIEDELGTGGMATVYLAEDLKHHRPVALKVLHPDLAAVVGAERFLREIETTAGLQHPGILALYDSGEADGLLYYTMPVVVGESLKEKLQREGQLPVDEAVRIAREVAEALEHAHGRGVLHRDIKPANILLEDGRVILADFGIARAVEPHDAERLTETGLAVGTPTYMSPEQSMAERRLDGRSDLYALGCVLYEMLAGEPPYTGATAQAILAKRFREPVPRVSTLRDTVTPGLEAILVRLLATSPADRHGSASLLVQALDEYHRSPGTPARASEGLRGGARWTRGGLLVGAAVVVAAVGVKLWVSGVGVDAESLSPDRLAVLPFTVRGAPDFDYLAEGMVDLMGAKLDGAGALTVVNPRAVISMVSAEQIDLGDPAAGERVARRFGAGRYLTGELTEVGGHIQLAAQLHELGSDAGSPKGASVSTKPDQLLGAIDSLALELLGETMDTPEARIQQLATATTASLPALKEFLAGERLMRAGGQYREATASFERAIALDPTFALAWYRKSSVGEWVDHFDVRSSADSAFKYSEGLSRRDRSLLEALRLRRVGLTEEAEQRYEAHLRTWPDEVDAIVQLGEIRFHDNPRRGRSMAEAIPFFQSALDLEPANADARIHLARLYALTGQLDSLEATVRHIEADFAANSAPGEVDGGGGERLIEVQALLASARGDSAAKADVLERLRGRPPLHSFVAAHGVSRFARDPVGALAIVTQREVGDPFLDWAVSSFYHVLGRREEAFRFVDDLPGGLTAQWELERAFVLTSGVVAPDTVRMRQVLESLRARDPAEIRRGNWVPAYEDLTDEFHRFERDWTVAQLLIHLGRVSEARRIMSALDVVPAMVGLGQVQPDAIRTLEAEIRYREGDRQGALDVLRTITYEVPHGATYHSLADGTRARYLQAELELERGDRGVAERLFRGLAESWSPWDGYHRPIAYQRLGEIAEVDGRTAEAITQYTRLVDLWVECDPELVPLREEIRARRDALAAS